MQGAPEVDTGSVHGTYDEDGNRGATPQMGFSSQSDYFFRNLCPVTRYITHSAMFVAWSAIRSR